MKFRDFVSIISANGFTLDRIEGSHRAFVGVVDGKRRVVTVSYHRASDDIKKGTLASMIRQSGLPKRLFR